MFLLRMHETEFVSKTADTRQVKVQTSDKRSNYGKHCTTTRIHHVSVQEGEMIPHHRLIHSPPHLVEVSGYRKTQADNQ